MLSAATSGWAKKRVTWLRCASVLTACSGNGGQEQYWPVCLSTGACYSVLVRCTVSTLLCLTHASKQAFFCVCQAMQWHMNALGI